jgi:hypothetical protein
MEGSAWTSETLKEYLDRAHMDLRQEINQRFADLDRGVKLAFEAQKLWVDQSFEAADRAILKAEVAAEKRFDSINEFRAVLGDQQKNFMPRSEVFVIEKAGAEKLESLRIQAEITHQSIFEKIETLSVMIKAAQAGKKGLGDGMTLVVAGVGVVISIGTFLMLMWRGK